jgi:hypothetical protein
MDSTKEERRLALSTRVVGLVFLCLSAVPGVAFLVLGSLYHLQGVQTFPIELIFMGVLYHGILLCSFFMDFPSRREKYLLSFFLSSFFAVALAILGIFLNRDSATDSIASLTLVILLSCVLLPAVLGNLVPILRLRGKETSIWFLAVCYVLEAVLWVVCLYFSFFLESKIFYLLIFAVILFRSSQYLLLLLTRSPR